MNKLNHVAFIMDGNGRWGKKRRKGRNFGHIHGVETVKKIVKASLKYRIPAISFYVFSTENWKRPRGEIKFLFSLIDNYFKKEIQNIIDNGIKINILGESKNLPSRLKVTLKLVTNKTKKNKKIIVNLAINYGSKKELIHAFNKVKKNSRITETMIDKNLYTKNIFNPDILIRTGGQNRLSNFMLWQLAYSEIYFVKKLWPDFKAQDLKKIIDNFFKVKRNFGGI